jgi:hypothetical protein
MGLSSGFFSDLGDSLVMDQSTEHPPNVGLIYEYTKHSYELARQNTAQLNIRLTAVLAAAGLLLRLTANTEDMGHVSAYLRLMVGIFATISIASCIAALATRLEGTGRVVSPQELMKNWYRTKTDEECRCFIINTWTEAIDGIDKLASKKAGWLNTGLALLALAGIALAIEIGYDAILQI